MILVCAGTQLPFPRLMQGVDAWCARHPDVRVHAQVGPGGAPLEHATSLELLDPLAYGAAVDAAELIVSHAGMGVVLTAIDRRKPLVVLPRLASRGEHRSEHQLQVSVDVLPKLGVHVARDEEHLRALLSGRHLLAPAHGRPGSERQGFLHALRRATERALEAAS